MSPAESFNKYRGEVAFPFVPGAVFRFTMRDLRLLADRYGEDYLAVWNARAAKFDPNVIADFTQRGWKGEGGSVAPKKVGENLIDFDDPPWPVQAVTNLISDALTFAITGKTPEEIAEEQRKAEEEYQAGVKAAFPEVEEEPGPSDGPAASSIASVGPDTGTV